MKRKAVHMSLGVTLFLITSTTFVLADTCVMGHGQFNDNLQQNMLDSYFEINAQIDANGEAKGSVKFLGYVNHSGGRNQFAGNVMWFCSKNISSLNIMGPYAGYAVFPGAHNHAILCANKNGKPNLIQNRIDNCDSNLIDVTTATLFNSGSNVKDTGTAPSGNLGFDDFNIAVVFGDNQFATSNGFIRVGPDYGNGYVYVGACENAPKNPDSFVINCDYNY